MAERVMGARRGDLATGALTAQLRRVARDGKRCEGDEGVLDGVQSASREHVALVGERVAQLGRQVEPDAACVVRVGRQRSLRLTQLQQLRVVLVEAAVAIDRLADGHAAAAGRRATDFRLAGTPLNLHARVVARLGVCDVARGTHTGHSSFSRAHRQAQPTAETGILTAA